MNLNPSSIIHQFIGIDKRSKKVGKNSVYMIAIQILSIGISMLLVPMTMGFVNPEIYGIWLTLSSIVGWISILNIGLNNSLRNRFTETVAAGNTVLAREYVSTTYALLGIIFGGFLILFLCINPFIDWAGILNLSAEYQLELQKAMAIVVTYFCGRFVLSSINVILLADQKSAESSFRTLIEQIVSFSVIYIFTKLVTGSLLYLCLGLCISPLILLLAYNVLLFRKRYKIFAPSFGSVDFSLTKNLLGEGIKFFVINIAGIIQFQLSNIIILRYFGGDQVTTYNIAFKYFNIPYMLFALLLTPLWSAITEAKSKNDYLWINTAIKRYMIISIIFCVIVVFMLLLSSSVYHIWLGKNYINVPFFLSLIIAIFNITYIWGGVFVTALNGMGILNTQMLACIIGPLIYIFLCFIFIEYTQFGIIGVVFASILSNFNGWILAPIQVKRRLSLYK